MSTSRTSDRDRQACDQDAQTRLVVVRLPPANHVTVFQHHSNVTLPLSMLTLMKMLYHVSSFSPLPNPPVDLLAVCLQCIAVITSNKPNEVRIDITLCIIVVGGLCNDYVIISQTWEWLGRTGFLPHLTSTFESVRRYTHLKISAVKLLSLVSFPPSISVAPGHYGQLLNVWERPRGTFPVSMAMLDLLLGMSRQAGGNLSTNQMLACVVYVMREMLSTSHSWRYRQPTSRDEIGGWS